MPSSKVYIAEDFENFKDYCRDRKEKQKSFKIELGSKDLSKLIAKQTAPKYVLKMMSSMDFSDLVRRKDHEDEVRQHENSLHESEIGIQFSSSHSDTFMIEAVESTARDFVRDLQSKDYMEDIADKIAGKKIDIEELIRDDNLSESVIDRKVNVLEHVRQKNYSSAFRLLMNYFDSASTVRLCVGNQLPQKLTIIEKDHKKKKSSGGMVIFINPDFKCSQPCTLSVSGTPPGESAAVTYSTILWSNGDPLGLELTSKLNLKGNLSTFGGEAALHSERGPRRSLPGWNGRIPLWVPFDACECSVQSLEERPSSLHSGVCDRDELLPETHSPALPFYKALSSPHNYQNLFSTNFESDLSFNQPFPHPHPLTLGTLGSASPLSRVFSATNTTSPSPMTSPGVLFLTAFACPSLEEALQRLTKLSKKYKSEETGNTALSGHIPALSLACQLGNIVAARKLLKCGADVNRVARATGCTPLHDAAACGHHHVVALLLQHGADQTVADAAGATPLHVCCQMNNVACARVLLADKRAGAAIASKDRAGRTPTACCAKQHLRDIIDQERLKLSSKFKFRQEKVQKKKMLPQRQSRASAAAQKADELRRRTAEEFMKMAGRVAKTFEGGKPVPKAKMIRL